MTILFPGRSEPPTRASKEFRDSVVQCIATRVDKRHIVHDFAVSKDNTVFVPRQDDEAQWAREDDWSGFTVVKLFSPDFRVDGKKTGYDILQGEWHLYQDGRVRAVEESQGMLSNKQKLPSVSAYRTKFGLIVGEGNDTYGVPLPQAPPPPQLSRSHTDPRSPPPRLHDVSRQAQAQYYNHHRRVVSDVPLAPFEPRYGLDMRASNYFASPPPPPAPRRRGSGGGMYAPPPGIPPPFEMGPPGIPPPPGGRQYDQDELGYNFPEPQMILHPFQPTPTGMSTPPPNFYSDKYPMQRRPTVLRKRSTASLSRRQSSSGVSQETKGSPTGNRPRRKLSRRKSGRLSSAGLPPDHYASPQALSQGDDGRGCVIC